MGKFSRLGNELYNGHKSIDFVGKRALWYTISGAIVLAALLVVILKGLNFGVEFTGGIQYRVSGLSSEQASQTVADDVREAIGESGVPGAESATVSTVAAEDSSSILIETEDLTLDESDRVVDAIREVTGASEEQLSQQEIGASWGQQVAQRAILGVVVFLILVMLFIWGYFREWKMSVAALAALFHDVVITVGVYSLSGFPVTPAAVTGVLAILGFSLYDTVVVFDKVRENTTPGEMKRTRHSYAEAANLAVNQTLVRSINTGIVALIPIGAILYVSAVQLGASSLKDLALSQFVGMAAGVFSSVWVAPRILVHLKSSETEVVLAERRARARKRAEADKYAHVPALAEDGPVGERPAELEDIDFEIEDDDEPQDSPRPATSGRGRIAPAPHSEVRPTNAAGRPQPSRQPRSKRSK